MIKKAKNRAGINDVKQSQSISGFGIVLYIAGLLRQSGAADAFFSKKVDIVNIYVYNEYIQ